MGDDVDLLSAGGGVRGLGIDEMEDDVLIGGNTGLYEGVVVKRRAVIERYRRATIPALEALWSKNGGAPDPHTDPRLAFGQAQVLILNQIATGKADRLPELLPELVYLTAGGPTGQHLAGVIAPLAMGSSI